MSIRKRFGVSANGGGSYTQAKRYDESKGTQKTVGLDEQDKLASRERHADMEISEQGVGSHFQRLASWGSLKSFVKNHIPSWRLQVVFVTSVMVYLNTLQGAFLHDDNPAILQNPDVRGTTSLLSLFENDFWGTPIKSNRSHKSYRPICVLTFRFEKHIFGFNPMSFHATNVWLHAVSSVLFTLMCQKIVFNGVENDAIRMKSSFLCGVLFGLHPIHTEAVAGIVGRAELLSAIFFLAALLCHNASTPCGQTLKKVEDNERNRVAEFATNIVPSTIKVGEASYHEVGRSSSFVMKTWYFSNMKNTMYFMSSLLLAACSMLSKENGVTVLGVLTVRELFFIYFSALRKRENRCTYYAHLRVLCVVAWTMVLLILRLGIMDWKQPIFAGPDNPASKSTRLHVRFLTYSYLNWVNFRLLLWPVNFVYDWSYGTIPLVVSWTDTRNVTTLFFTMGCILGIVYITLACLKYDTEISPPLYGVILLVFPHLPSSNLFFPVGFVIAERVLYLPSMGFVILLVIAWTKFHCRFHFSRNLSNFIMVVCVLSYATQTWRRNADWRSKETLFRSGLEVAPNNAKIRYNWANLLRDSGKYKEAATEYEKTLGLYPGYAGALNNLATILEMDDRTSLRAEELYVRLIRIQPGRVDAYANLADLLMRKKRYDTAVDVYARLLDAYGSNVVHVISLAELLLKHDMTTHAERLYMRVLTHYCVIQRDDDIWKILKNSKQGHVVKRPGTCISNINDLPRVLRGYAELKSRNGFNEEAKLLFKRVLMIDEHQAASTAFIFTDWRRRQFT